MRAVKLITTLVLAALLASQAAQAITIGGTIEFAGNNQLLNKVGPSTGNINTDADFIDFGMVVPVSVTEPDGFDSDALLNAVVTSVSGDYSAIPASIFFGAAATFTDFSMGELGTTGPLVVDPLWVVEFGAYKYSFRLTAITGNSLGAGGQRTLSGVGFANIVPDSGPSPFDETPGTWTFSQSGTASFTAATSVPDAGASALLLGLGLAGLGAAVIRFRK